MSYARIDEGFWTDPLIKSLSLEGKLIAAWLFTNPHRHFSGIYYLPKVLIADEIGVSIDVCERELKVLEDKGYSKYSPNYSVVWVVKMLPHQTGGGLNEKQAKGISSQLKTLHGCPLIKEFLERYKAFEIKYDTSIHTPTDTKSQSKSKSKSKSQSKKGLKKDATPGEPVVAVPSPPKILYSCKHFELDEIFIKKLLAEHPGLTSQRLKQEVSNAHDWLDDNPKVHKRRANGQLKNPRMFLKNWLKNIVIEPGSTAGGMKEAKGLAALRESTLRRGGPNVD